MIEFTRETEAGEFDLTWAGYAVAFLVALVFLAIVLGLYAIHPAIAWVLMAFLWSINIGRSISRRDWNGLLWAIFWTGLAIAFLLDAA